MHPTPSRTDGAAGRPDWLTAAVALGGLLVAYYAVPLASLLVAQPPGTVLARLGDPDVVGAAATSLLSATTTTIVSTALGVPLAYWLARREGPLATAVTGVVVLPLVLPPVVSGLVLLTVVGPGTLVGGLAAAGGLQLTGSLAGVVLAQTFVASPFVVVTAKSAFEGIDPALERASRSLGKGRLTTARRVTLPLAWPGILGGVTLAFARAMGEFGATLMLAYYPRTMPVEIWVSFSTRGLAAAFPVAVVLVAVSAAALAAVHLTGVNPLT